MSHQCHQQKYVCVPTPAQPDINGQIINEREQLRMQLMELEDRYQIDIEELKINLLSESERILQKSMNEQAAYYEPLLQQRDAQISQLTTRLQSCEQTLVQTQQENTLLKNKIRVKKDKIKYYKHEFEQQGQYHIGKIQELDHIWTSRLSKELARQKEQLESEFHFERKNLEEIILKLKQQLASFDDKYQQMVFELERLKQQLLDKNHELDEQRNKYKQLEHRLVVAQNVKIEPPNTIGLEMKIQQLEKQIQLKDAKLAQRKEKVQYITQQLPPQQIIVDRTVDRIIEVEKIVPVERIIRERIPNRQPIVVNQTNTNEQDDSEYKDKYKECKQELQVYKSKTTELTNSIQHLKHDLEEVLYDRDQLKQHYDNLLVRVRDMEEQLKSKNRELQERINSLGKQTGNDNIIVHVNQGKNKSSHVLKR